MSGHNRPAASRAWRAEAAWRRRALVVLSIALCSFASAPTAFGQGTATNARFVLGPLQWAPTLQLREAGIDSNIFNSDKDVKQDMTGSFVPAVDALLTLGIAQVATQGSAEYVYFERYKNQRALNGRVNSRVTLPFSRVQPVALVSYARVKERAGNEIDVRAPRTEQGYGVNLTTRLTSRVALTATIDRASITYDSGVTFRGTDLATQLNRRSTNLITGLRVAFSPLTSFVANGGVGRDEFVLQRERNTDNFRGDVGVEFAPDAVIGGRASIGYRKMQPQHDSGTPGGAVESGGLTSAVDLSYTLLGRTRFNPRYSRDKNYSISTTQPYYVSTGAGLEILQTLFGPFGLAVRGARETLAYQATALAAARTDVADTLGGGFTIRLSTQGRIGLNYEDSKRRSDAGAEFGYGRRRIYTTVTYGF